MGVLGLFRLTPIQTLMGALIHHNVCQDGVERHDRQMTPAYGVSDGQGRDVESSLLTSTGSRGPRVMEKTDLAILEAFRSLFLLLLPPL